MTLWLHLMLFESVQAVILFATAGRLDLPWFWAVLAVHATILALGGWTIDPELIRERRQPGPDGQDRNLRRISLLFYLAHLILTGLDVGRFDWSGSIPAAVQAIALVGYAVGMGLAIWAVAVNRFFSPVVRIQRERGHHLVTDGPYRYLRHPGYAGGLVCSLCGGIALGSWWSVVPLTPVVLLIVRRALLEDRFLRGAMADYPGYAERVRYRLVPGVW